MEQKFGPLTTWRQNHALEICKTLKNSGIITNGYVSYPAKLMVKYRKADTKYTLHHDYSDTEVVFVEHRHKWTD